MSLADEEEDDIEDDYARRARERKEREEIEAGIKLDGRYRDMINECLKADGTPFNDEDDEELQTWLDDVDELIVDYRGHSGLRQIGNMAQERLEDLYWLRDKFNRMLVKWQKQEISWFKTSEPIYFGLSGKRRALLRAHLLLK